MKTKIFTLLGIVFLFFSCQNEPLDLQEDALQTFSFSSSQRAVSCEPDFESLHASLPNTVSIQTTANPGDDAYFDFDILNTDLAATGLQGWCGDVDGYLEVEGPYEFSVYSSYEDFPTDQFENPQNFPLVNWILNQDFIGKVSPISGETYTYGMVQWAIWELLDDRNCINCYYLTGDVKDGWKNNKAALEAIAMELVDAAIANGQGFVPGCGQQVALMFIANERNANNQIIQSIIYTVDVPEKVIEECFECEGKVTELELQYNGDQEATIRVETKGKGKKKTGAVVFEGTVAPGETFSFVGNDKKGTLGTEIKIYVNDDENTKIHTSCSKPIGPGLISGDFEVISGSSREGGNLCPIDTPPGGDDCSECEGKVTNLELQYNGSAAATITVKTKKDGEHGGNVVFNETVMPGESFSFVGNDKKGTLGTEITIYVDGSINTKIHTSCSKPIGPGLVSGDFEVLSGSSREGGELCPINTPPGGGDCNECDGKITRLDLQYNGGASANIEVVQKKDGIMAFSGNVNPGETFTFYGKDDKGTLGTEITIFINGSEAQKIHTSCSVEIGAGSVFGDFTVMGGASRNGGELCPVDTTPPASAQCDCDGKIVKMSVVYSGPNDVTVTVAGEDGNIAKTFYNVLAGDILEADLGNVGKWWYWSVDGNLQASIHTSCSDDILGNVDASKSVFGNMGTYPDPADDKGNKNDGTFLVSSHTDENGNTCSLDLLAGGH
jgi:hypothetical protein